MRQMLVSKLVRSVNSTEVLLLDAVWKDSEPSILFLVSATRDLDGVLLADLVMRPLMTAVDLSVGT